MFYILQNSGNAVITTQPHLLGSFGNDNGLTCCLCLDCYDSNCGCCDCDCMDGADCGDCGGVDCNCDCGNVDCNCGDCFSC